MYINEKEGKKSKVTIKKDAHTHTEKKTVSVKFMYMRQGWFAPLHINAEVSGYLVLLTRVIII